MPSSHPEKTIVFPCILRYTCATLAHDDRRGKTRSWIVNLLMCHGDQGTARSLPSGSAYLQQGTLQGAVLLLQGTLHNDLIDGSWASTNRIHMRCSYLEVIYMVVGQAFLPSLPESRTPHERRHLADLGIKRG
jgi:hypothetical protein